MKAKNEISFEYIKEETIYRFTMPHGSPLGEAYEAAASFLEEMVRLINEHAAKMKEKDEEESETEEK